MRELVFYLIVFIFVYLFYVIFVLNRKNILKKFPEGKEMKYLKFKYGIKVNDKNIKEIANKVFLANSFIISTTVFVVCLFNSLFIQILVGIITMIILLLGIYHIIGIYLKNKQGGK